MLKRNQVDAAIGRLLEPGSAKPSSLLRSRIRRLLETDRRLGRNRRSGNPERANFAFFSEEMPGRGIENWYSEYEAFALLTGLRLMQHHWPQGFVVALLRRVRPQLEKEHARILSLDPALLFDEQSIRRRARPGDIAVENIDPVFLGIVTKQIDDRANSTEFAICRGQGELMALLRKHGLGHAMTSYELASLMHALSAELERTRPRSRGRMRGAGVRN